MKNKTVLSLLMALTLHAQVPAPAFEAATVKPPDPNARVGMAFTITGSRLVSTNLTLDTFIQQAYGVRYYQVLGAPSWSKDDKFNIDATAGKDASREEMLAMIRTLLEDRFKLKAHKETREGTVYVLTLGKGPHKLKPSPEDAGRPLITTRRNTPGDQPGASYTAIGKNATLSQLIENLSGTVQRPVTDQTGITGNFDFQFDYATLDAPPEAGPSIFAAVDSQLGLKLEARKGPVEVLIVDHAEKPTAN